MSRRERLSALRDKLRENIAGSDISASMHPFIDLLMRIDWCLAHPDDPDCPRLIENLENLAKEL